MPGCPGRQYTPAPPPTQAGAGRAEPVAMSEGVVIADVGTAGEISYPQGRLFSQIQTPGKVFSVYFRPHSTRGGYQLRCMGQPAPPRTFRAQPPLPGRLAFLTGLDIGNLLLATQPARPRHRRSCPRAPPKHGLQGPCGECGVGHDQEASATKYEDSTSCSSDQDKQVMQTTLTDSRRR